MDFGHNVVDNQQPLGYNASNNVVYDAVVEHYLYQPVIVKMDEQSAINDTSCQHETLIPDPDDTIGEAIYYGCANSKCGKGFYMRPNAQT